MAPTADEEAWLRLALAEGVGPVTVLRLLGRHGSVRRAARATGRDLAAVGRPPSLAAALERARPRAAWQEAHRLGQRILTPATTGWPGEAFRALCDPPAALFLRGALPPADARCVAVVGSRDAGGYGNRMARQLAEGLAAHGIWIVSGLAVGIDASAHAGALAVPQGRTVAALGCGIDVPYPLENLDLKEAVVAEEGGIFSEHPPGTRPRPGHFPRRNRLVAALADATVVVAAGWRSGAIITAQHALDLGRQVLAVPGPCSRDFRGSHQLLRRGEAALCETVRDVLLALDPSADPAGLGERPPAPAPPDGPPLAVWSALEPDAVLGPDELCRRSGLDAGAVIEALAFLEVEGYVARVPGLGFRRA